MHSYVLHRAGIDAGKPCRLYAPSGLGRCGKPIAVVVDVYDRDVHPGRHARRFGACEDHAGYYRLADHGH